MPSEGLTVLGQLFGRNRLHLVKDGCVIIEENGKQASLKKCKSMALELPQLLYALTKRGTTHPSRIDIAFARPVMLYCSVV
ncbi:hypothetical protein SAMN05421863_10208 [Nitrosomonas communis]|uniref:Uncharacterized protein n=1 Tax=Nitrosomonas communis TaxID=44574 RepID=A0A1I4PFK4_9PROT|nr:hypothetical protein SAMN05421863_10208 [Nitrosomonas communis]